MNQYMFNLSVILRLGKEYAEQKLSRQRLRFPELSVLMYLARYRQSNQEMMARYFMLDKGTIAKSIRKLEQKELIEKHRNAENKRENIVSLTAEGEELMEQMRVLFEEWRDVAFQGISNAALADFERVLNRIVENLYDMEEMLNLEPL